MGKALSTDLRQRVVDAYERGEGTQAEIAARFGVGEASVRRWLALKRETGRLAPRVAERYGLAPLIEVANLRVLESLIAEHPDGTNDELATLLAEATGVLVSASTISRSIGILGWTRKKSALSQQKPTLNVSAIFVQSGPSGRRR